MKMNLKWLLTFSILVTVVCFSCKDDPVIPKEQAKLTLAAEDVSCTEVWINLTTTNLKLPTTLNLLRDDNIFKTINLQTADTLIYIDSLLPNQTYNLQVSSIQHQATSNELSVTTMDTTSHNFTWQTFEFGIIANQSHLFDVAIINENDIWVVGAIYMNDSLGNPDPQVYNAVHWNGIEWALKRITVNFRGFTITPILEGIFALSSSQIWLAGGLTIYGDGSNWIPYDVRLITGIDGLSLSKIWGSSPTNMYFVGRNGNIAHYNGSQWTKIESGTNLSLSDIAVNSSNEIFICGGNSSLGQGIILKSTDGNNFSVFAEGANISESQLFNPKLYGSFSSIWFDQNNTLYSGGNILFQNKFDRWSYVKSLPENFIGGNPGVYYRGFITKVRGNASNDMWIVGDRNTLRHFNGFSWQQIGMPYDPSSDVVWRGMACKGNNTIIIGTRNRNAIIMMIKKVI